MVSVSSILVSSKCKYNMCTYFIEFFCEILSEHMNLIAVELSCIFLHTKKPTYLYIEKSFLYWLKKSNHIYLLWDRSDVPTSTCTKVYIYIYIYIYIYMIYIYIYDISTIQNLMALSFSCLIFRWVYIEASEIHVCSLFYPFFFNKLQATVNTWSIQ